jgi:hypothetical protein
MRFVSILTLIIAIFSLSGCSSLKDTLGISRKTPDEFAVITRAPLQIPENLNSVSTLPAPQIGAARPQETDPRQLAKQALGVTPGGAPSTSAAEQSLLSKVGGAEQGIRTTVDREAITEKEEQRPVAKRLLNIGNDTPPARIVDPVKEKERLQSQSKAETPSKID